jgi:hypothetical protein
MFFKAVSNMFGLHFLQKKVLHDKKIIFGISKIQYEYQNAELIAYFETIGKVHLCELKGTVA